MPINNALLKSFSFKTEDSSLDSDWKSIFNRYKELISCEYAVRLDGIFLIRIQHTDNLSEIEWRELCYEIPDQIKRNCYHIHNFHSFPPSSPLDLILHIPPVEAEVPAVNGITNGHPQELKYIIDPSGGGICLAQLPVLTKAQKPNKPGQQQRALLRLRALYAQKKDLCLLVLQRNLERKKWDFRIFPIGVVILTLIILYPVLKYGINASSIKSFITAFIPAFIPAFGIGILLYLGRHHPNLEMLQHVIGFYSYAAIFSQIVESIYLKSHKEDKSFYCSTDNFTGAIKVLEARYALEKDKFERWKSILGLSFAMIAVSVAMIRLVVE